MSETKEYLTHITESGESLAGVALRQLGDVKRWTEIAELNNIQNASGASYMPTGTVLKLPSEG